MCTFLYSLTFKTLFRINAVESSIIAPLLISSLNYLLQPDIMFCDAFYFAKERRGKLDTQDEFRQRFKPRQIEHTNPLYVYRRATYKSSRPINKAFERERSLQHVRDDRCFALSLSISLFLQVIHKRDKRVAEE